jgi:hypothetical protein
MQPKTKRKGNTMNDTTTSKIAELNDLCRKAMGVAGKLFQTAGIDALPLADQSAIREKVETFDAFMPDILRTRHAARQRRPERPTADRSRPHHHARTPDHAYFNHQPLPAAA